MFILMAENPTLTPRKKYEGPKYDLMESISDLCDRIREMDHQGIAKELEKYKDIIP